MSNVIIPVGAAPDYLTVVMLLALLMFGGMGLAGMCGEAADINKSSKGVIVGITMGGLAMATGMIGMFLTVDRSDDAWDKRHDTVASAIEEQVGVEIPTDSDLFDDAFTDDAQTVTLKVKGTPVNCYVEVTDRTESETRLAVSCGNDEFRLLPTLD